jgi:ribose 5-phosphate isomerase B
MHIYIGADHQGHSLKAKLVEYLQRAGYSVTDVGDEKFDPDDDFPQFAARAVMSMQNSEEEDPRGVLVCGSGQGMCIAANRFPGIYATLVYSQESAREARNDDNSNVLCLPAHLFDNEEEKARVIVETWLNASFSGAARHKRRLKQLDDLRP